MASCYVQGGRFEITNISQVSNAIQQQTNSIKEPGGIAPLRFCHWAAPEWGNAGATAENNFYKAALLAVSTLNTVAQISIAQKQFQIARDYLSLAQDRLNRFNSRYRPLEIAMLNEVGNTPIPTPDYVFSASLYEGNSDIAFSKSSEHMAELQKKYSLCFDSTLTDDFNLAQGLYRDDSINFGFRNEEYYAIITDDLRFNRRSNLLNLGRDLAANAANYAANANSIFSRLSGLANQGAESAAYALGFLNNRNETTYSPLVTGTAGDNLLPTLYGSADLGPQAEVISTTKTK